MRMNPFQGFPQFDNDINNNCIVEAFEGPEGGKNVVKRVSSGGFTISPFSPQERLLSATEETFLQQVNEAYIIDSSERQYFAFKVEVTGGPGGGGGGDDEEDEDEEEEDDDKGGGIDTDEEGEEDEGDDKKSKSSGGSSAKDKEQQKPKSEEGSDKSPTSTKKRDSKESRNSFPLEGSTGDDPNPDEEAVGEEERGGRNRGNQTRSGRDRRRHRDRDRRRSSGGQGQCPFPGPYPFPPPMPPWQFPFPIPMPGMFPPPCYPPPPPCYPPPPPPPCDPPPPPAKPPPCEPPPKQECEPPSKPQSEAPSKDCKCLGEGWIQAQLVSCVQRQASIPPTCCSPCMTSCGSPCQKSCLAPIPLARKGMSLASCGWCNCTRTKMIGCRQCRIMNYCCSIMNRNMKGPTGVCECGPGNCGGGCGVEYGGGGGQNQSQGAGGTMKSEYADNYRNHWKDGSGSAKGSGGATGDNCQGTQENWKITVGGGPECCAPAPTPVKNSCPPDPCTQGQGQGQQGMTPNYGGGQGQAGGNAWSGSAGGSYGGWPGNGPSGGYEYACCNQGQSPYGPLFSYPGGGGGSGRNSEYFVFNDAEVVLVKAKKCEEDQRRSSRASGEIKKSSKGSKRSKKRRDKNKDYDDTPLEGPQDYQTSGPPPNCWPYNTGGMWPPYPGPYIYPYPVQWPGPENYYGPPPESQDNYDEDEGEEAAVYEDPADCRSLVKKLKKYVKKIVKKSKSQSPGGQGGKKKRRRLKKSNTDDEDEAMDTEE